MAYNYKNFGNQQYSKQLYVASEKINARYVCHAPLWIGACYRLYPNPDEVPRSRDVVELEIDLKDDIDKLSRKV